MSILLTSLQADENDLGDIRHLSLSHMKEITQLFLELQDYV